jgi:membrane protease YdiL (CAAX protease family)
MTKQPKTVRTDVPFSSEPARGWLPWGLLAPFLGLAFVVIPALATDDLFERYGFLTPKGDPAGTQGMIVFLLVPFALTGLIVAGWTLLVERRPLATIGLTRSGGAKQLLSGLAIGAAMILAVVAGSWAVGALDAGDYVRAFESPSALGAITVLLLCFVVQSGVEEILFRGWLLSAVARKFNPLVGVVLTTMLFTLLHYSRGQPLLSTLTIVLFSVFACCWALKARSIWGVMGWHAGWNWLLATGFELRVTGLDAGVPALLVKLSPVGPDYLTGGAEGPEGSIFCALVLAAGIGLILARRDRLRQAPPLG